VAQLVQGLPTGSGLPRWTSPVLQFRPHHGPRHRDPARRGTLRRLEAVGPSVITEDLHVSVVKRQLVRSAA
jgi:hypothetical protein